MERKSFELYVQAANWFGGLAAAALGGVLLALLNADTPATMVVWLQRMGVVLMFAIAGAAYSQFHAIKQLNDRENEPQPPAAAAPAAAAAASAMGAPMVAPAVAAPAAAAATPPAADSRISSLAISQFVMFGALLVGALMLAFALASYKREKKEAVPAPWVVGGIGVAPGGSFVVMTSTDSALVRILMRNPSTGLWCVETVRPEDATQSASASCVKPVDASAGPPVTPPEKIRQKPPKSDDFDPSTK